MPSLMQDLDLVDIALHALGGALMGLAIVAFGYGREVLQHRGKGRSWTESLNPRKWSKQKKWEWWAWPIGAATLIIVLMLV